MKNRIFKLMNYLAHLHLSFDDPPLLVGNFIADSLSPTFVKDLPRDIYKGVLLHREIDSFMDQHELVKQGVQRLKRRHFRYAPVVIDIYYDYFLAKHWNQFGRRSLEAFSQGVYDVLMQYLAYFPPSLQRSVPKMVEHNWLFDYGNYEGLAYVFSRFEYKVSKPEWLKDVITTLKEDEALLEEEFLEFFPQIEALSQKIIYELKS